MRRLFLAAVMAAPCVGLTGCGDGKPKVQTFDAPAPDPIAEAKAMLSNYAKGQPVTSEAESFPELIERAKAKDPAKGAILEKGLNDIAKNRGSAASKAAELLKKL